jgi:phage shock protein PspC (stress-responsive transcriptional regulator)
MDTARLVATLRTIAAHILAGLGITFLLTIPAWQVFTEPSHLGLYHSHLPVTQPIEALLVDLCFIFLLTTCLLLASDRLPARFGRSFWACISFFFLWYFAYYFLAHYIVPAASGPKGALGWCLGAMGFLQKRKKVILLLGMAATLVGGLVTPRFTSKLSHASRIIIACFGLTCLWVPPYLVYLAIIPEPSDSGFYPSALLRPEHQQHQRLIWILLDELSYDQAFDHRAAGVSMPNLDRFRARSFSFGDLSPDGYYTDLVIPSLFIGQPIMEISSTPQGALRYRNESQHHWIAFDPKATLFALARSKGWSTGVAGSYIPYCRIFASELDECYWTPLGRLPLQSHSDPDNDTILSDALRMPDLYLKKLEPGGQQAIHRNESLHTLQDVIPEADKLIADGRIEFAFLHFLVPHPPGFYDRRAHTVRMGGTYLDNLVLADGLFGHLMRQIALTPSAGQTIVIVSSDHSWRVPMWKASMFWSEEEERASGGRFDSRPVLLVHFPGQKYEEDVNTGKPEMIVHGIITQIIQGRITDSENFKRFLNTWPSSQ